MTREDQESDRVARRGYSGDSWPIDYSNSPSWSEPLDQTCVQQPNGQHLRLRVFLQSTLVLCLGAPEFHFVFLLLRGLAAFFLAFSSHGFDDMPAKMGFQTGYAIQHRTSSSRDSGFKRGHQFHAGPKPSRVNRLQGPRGPVDFSFASLSPPLPPRRNPHPHQARVWDGFGIFLLSLARMCDALKVLR